MGSLRRIKLGPLTGFLILGTMLLGCASDGLHRESQDENLALPDFSFIGLAEPRGDRENIQMTVHVKIPYSELKFVRDGKRYTANFEIGVTLSDEMEERIAGSIWKDSISVAQYDITRSDERFVEAADSFLVPASKMRVTVRVTDLFTKKSRLLSDVVDHSGIYERELSLGNLVILEDGGSGRGGKVLTHQSFYEIIDTLNFRIRILGQKGPYALSYSLYHKDEEIEHAEDTLWIPDAIDSTLSFHFPLTDMHFSAYSLVFAARDGAGSAVKTKTNFKVNISGIQYQVGDLEEAIKQLRYIAGERQMRFMLDGSEEERMEKFKAFWAERDPSPGTGPNELMEEYYRRIHFSIEAFTNVQDGWKTDRGMVYVLFGSPDEIEQQPFEINTKPYEIWHYYHLSRDFVFVDETGFGDYRLVNRYTDQRDWRFRY